MPTPTPTGNTASRIVRLAVRLVWFPHHTHPPVWLADQTDMIPPSERARLMHEHRNVSTT